MESRMLGELEVVVFIKSNDEFGTLAERVFGVLGSLSTEATAEELGGRYFQSTGMGFEAIFFSNTGEMLDPEFEAFPYGLEITSRYWCVDLDSIDLEGALSEYYSRLIAFDLGMETATEVLVETTEQSDVYEIRSYRRNPQFRLDQAPTTPKVFVVESRLVEDMFDEKNGDWDETAGIEDDGDEAVDEEDLR
jgi:hypothetical protein